MLLCCSCVDVTEIGIEIKIYYCAALQDVIPTKVLWKTQTVVFRWGAARLRNNLAKENNIITPRPGPYEHECIPEEMTAQP